MSKEEMIEALGRHYGCERNDNGEYDLSDYDWQSGCYKNGRLFSLADVVDILEQFCED